MNIYQQVADGAPAFYPLARGLIAVWGNESVQFLNGMITNDVAKLADGGLMSAAFPNAQGRLIATARVRRDGGRFLIETENETRERVFNNLFRFTFAGDFCVDDLSDRFSAFSAYNLNVATDHFEFGPIRFVLLDLADALERESAGWVGIDRETYETLRIESGIPVFGVDCDETTIVPELGTEGLISYTKGCYIGQEIIARIHFRGHVAKQLRGIIADGALSAGSELTSSDGKPAGRVTSAAYSPIVGKHIALGYVRYDFLAGGTKLVCEGTECQVAELPIVRVR